MAREGTYRIEKRVVEVGAEFTLVRGERIMNTAEKFGGKVELTILKFVPVTYEDEDSCC